MNSINERGKFLLQTLGVTLEQLTQQHVFDIISLQDNIYPYSDRESQKIHWKIHRKKAQQGHLDIDRFRKRFFDFEK